MAGVIDTLPLATPSPGGFGETIPNDKEVADYFAQTFVALGDNMQSLDLKIATGGPADTKYHVLITTVKDLPGGQFQPGEILMEIEGQVEPFDGTGSFKEVHFNLKGLELEEGETYAFIIDSVAARDGDEDIASIGLTLGSSYPGGFPSVLATASGRALDFAADWTEEESGAVDIAFRAVFSDPGKTINGTKKDDKLNGKSKDDIINGKKGADKLKGKDGYDELIGGKHDDKLIGGADGDRLIGGKGLDILKGGSGKDCYFFDFKMTKKSAKKNMDTIKGFSTEDDAIYLQQSKFSSLPVGDYDSASNGLSYKNGKLKYEGVTFAEFKGSKPSSLEDIDIVVYA